MGYLLDIHTKQVEDLAILARDEKIKLYAVETVWG